MATTRRRVFVAVCLVAGNFIASATPALAEKLLRFQHPLSSDSHYGAAAAAFKETFERVTVGRYRIIVERNDNERHLLEGVQRGDIDFGISSTGPIGSIVPPARNLDVPFLFRDSVHARGLLDGPIGRQILAEFSKRDLIGVIWLENGFRHLTTSRRAVHTPADLKGLKLRTMENEVHIRAVRTLGAQAVPMAFGDVVAALQQGLIDGQENPISVIVSSNLDKVQKHLTLSGHAYSAAVLVAAPKTFSSFSDTERGALGEAARAALAANRDRVDRDDKTGVEELRRRGMAIVPTIDRSAFQAALSPAYEAYSRELDGLLLVRIRTWRSK